MIIKPIVPEERILCAAIHYVVYPHCFSLQGHPVTNSHIYSGLVLCGWRHNNIITQFFTLTQIATGPSNSVQGFLTSKGRFVDRKEAYLIAEKQKQLLYNRSVDIDDVQDDYPFTKELYSEDLY